ncbi:glycine zipper domain-containing protein [Endozoicomonas ascidiicola]|uniref:glycine zipper domain-containing protein n=1 Tax=Endozoicomonas ascidiicola TaxID=1698521 RepID=UPI00082EB771|nr:glycine zipper domain-containing protein [Endozoicomonas ascidiicola]
MSQKNDIGIRITGEVDKRTIRAFRTTAKESENARKRMIGNAGRDTRAIGQVARSQGRLNRTVKDVTRSIGREDQAFKRASRSIGDYDRKIKAATKSHSRLKKAAKATGNAINTKVATIGGGAAVGLSAKQLVDDEAFWTRLKTDSSASAEKIESLKNRTFDMAVKMRINPTMLKASIAEIQKLTGDLDLASENLENMAIGIQGSGSTGVDIGGLVANLNKKMGLRSAKEMLENLDIAKQLGDKGAFTLKDYSSMGGRVLSDLGARGITGTQGNVEAMSLLQFGMTGTSTKDTAVSASKAVTRDLLANRDELEGFGVDLFDQTKPGEQMRLPSVVLKELFDATEGLPTQLTKVFGDEAFELIKPMMIDYQNGWKDYDNYLGTQGDGKALTNAAMENRNTASSNLTYISALWNSFLDDAGSSLISSTASLFEDTDNDTAKKVVGSTGLGAMGMAGGASLGAAIGSIVPVVGTAVGAGVGALIGGMGGALSGYFLSEDQERPADQQARALLQEFQKQERSIQQKAAASSSPVTVNMGDMNFIQKEGERDEEFLERARQMMREEMERAADKMRRDQQRQLTDY